MSSPLTIFPCAKSKRYLRQQPTIRFLEFDPCQKPRFRGPSTTIWPDTTGPYGRDSDKGVASDCRTWACSSSYWGVPNTINLTSSLTDARDQDGAMFHASISG